MDKSSIYLLQCVDANCNDCFFLVRNIEEYNNSLERHHKWQLDYFNTVRSNLIRKAEDWRKKGEMKKYSALYKEVEKMKFQFNRNEAMINYGFCSKLNKAISFIPNTCQLHTQKCFEHRSDLKNA